MHLALIFCQPSSFISILPPWWNVDLCLQCTLFFVSPASCYSSALSFIPKVVCKISSIQHLVLHLMTVYSSCPSCCHPLPAWCHGGDLVGVFPPQLNYIPLTCCKKRAVTPKHLPVPLCLHTPPASFDAHLGSLV